MRNLTATALAAIVAVSGMACAPGFHAVADTTAQPSGARPDLTGTWTNASLTGLSRPRGVDKLVVTEEEALRIARSTAVAGISAEDAEFSDARTDPNAGAPKKGGSDFGLKGYNSFWVAPGETLAKVKGEYRTSYIVEPANGQVPFSKAAAPVLAERSKGFTRYLTGVGGNEGPEATNLAERCLIGFGQTGGPGMLSVLYNNTHEIVQAPDHVLIVVEMNHDARVVPLFADAATARRNHRPDTIKPWLGDSVGWYENGALMIETINVHPQQAASGSFPMTPQTRVTERLTRVSPEEIFYEFTVEDPTLYTQPWKGELSFRPATGRQYEYACHEGNYAMPGILHGARLQEEAALKAKK